jgi:hypothetical protein
LEYRKIKAITNGTVSEEEFGRGRISQDLINNQIYQWKKMQARDLKTGMSRGKAIPRPAQ